MISVTREEEMLIAVDKVSEAHKAIEHAIGALDMAAAAGGSDLLGGYSGTSAVRYLREAGKLVGRAKAVLDVLPR